MYMDVYVGDHGGQKRVSESLELEFKRVVSRLTWVLETELWYSARAVTVLNM